MGGIQTQKKDVKMDKRMKKKWGGRKHFYVCLHVPESVCACVCVVAMSFPGPNLFSKPHDPVRNSKWLMSGLTGGERSVCVCVCVFSLHLQMFMCMPSTVSISLLRELGSTSKLKCLCIG